MPPHPKDERKIAILKKQIADWEEALEVAIREKARAERLLPLLREALDDALGIERNPAPELGELSHLKLIKAVVLVLREMPPGPVKIKDTLLPILKKRGAYTGRQHNKPREPLSKSKTAYRAVRTACSSNAKRHGTVIYSEKDDTVELPRPR